MTVEARLGNVEVALSGLTTRIDEWLRRSEDDRASHRGLDDRVRQLETTRGDLAPKAAVDSLREDAADSRSRLHDRITKLEGQFFKLSGYIAGAGLLGTIIGAIVVAAVIKGIGL